MAYRRALGDAEPRSSRPPRIRGLPARAGRTPGRDDAETLVARLVPAGTAVRAPLVAEVLRGCRPAVAATGLTRGAVRQIERARTAAELLAAGARPPTSSPSSATSTSRTWPGHRAPTSDAPSGSWARARAGAIALDQRLTS
ncbi:hypothetical protein [Actinophytocola sp.]|uniref:hypothetical protein n=1 Tax=Actinophytocola sp. TaxID=1872138 RepID=UPI00389A701E